MEEGHIMYFSIGDIVCYRSRYGTVVGERGIPLLFFHIDWFDGISTPEVVHFSMLDRVA